MSDNDKPTVLNLTVHADLTQFAGQLTRIEQNQIFIIERIKKVMDDLDTIISDLQDETNARVAMISIMTLVENDLTAALAAPKLDPAKIASIRGFIATNKGAMVDAGLQGTAADATANPKPTGGTGGTLTVLPSGGLKLGVGGTQQLVVDDASGADVTAGSTFTSDNPSVASVSTAGLVTGASVGSANINVTSGGNTGTVAVTVA